MMLSKRILNRKTSKIVEMSQMIFKRMMNWMICKQINNVLQNNAVMRKSSTLMKPMKWNKNKNCFRQMILQITKMKKIYMMASTKSIQVVRKDRIKQYQRIKLKLKNKRERLYKYMSQKKRRRMVLIKKRLFILIIFLIMSMN